MKLLAALLVLLPSVAFAQPEEEIEIDDASTDEKKPAAPPVTPADAAPSPAVPPATRPSSAVVLDTTHGPPQPLIPKRGFEWEPFGYLRMQYVMVQNDPNVAFVGRDDGFQLQNARAGVRGRLGDHAAFVLSIDGAVDDREQLNIPEGRLRVGLRDAYADLVVGGGVVVRGGYFNTMVDPQAQIADVVREFVDRPLESRGVRPNQGFQTPSLLPGRSQGVALRLDPQVPETGVRVGFELAVQNGSDEFASNNDNDKPAVSASVLARFAGDSHVVASGRFNPRTVGELPFRQDETDLQGSAGLRLVLGPAVIGGGIAFQRTTFPSTGGPAQNAFGGHAQLMIRIPGPPLAVGYRFGILDPSSLITTDRVMEHTAGAVLGIPRYRMRVQLQAVYVGEQRELSNSRLQLGLEVAL
jgi:hypothetical protein